MKKNRIFILGLIIFLILIFIIYIEFKFLFELNLPEQNIKYVNIVNVERTPFDKEICKSCFTYERDSCIDNLIVFFNVAGNYKYSFRCRTYVRDNEGNEQTDVPVSMGSGSGYIGYNSAGGFISDLRENYKAKTCCWTDKEEEAICSAETNIAETCNVVFKNQY